MSKDTFDVKPHDGKCIVCGAESGVFVICDSCRSTREKCHREDDFKLGDKVRVKAAWLDRKGDVYTVDVVTLTAVRAYSDNTVLCLRKDKWIHA